MSERVLPLFPLHVVLFPGMRLPLHIFEERYRLMIRSCLETDRTFGVSLIASGQEVAGPATIHLIGTTAEIVHLEEVPDGRMNLVAVGVARFKLLERLDDQPYAVGRVRLLIDEPENVSARLTDRVTLLFREYLERLGLAREKTADLALPADPLTLSYLVASTIKAPGFQRQQLLAAESVELRLRRELSLLAPEARTSPAAGGHSFSLN